MELRITALTNTGRRERNEDRILLGEEILAEGRKDLSILLDGDACYLIALADGMGGYNAGEVAAEMVLKLMAREVHSVPSGLSESTLLEQIRSWAQKVHAQVLEESQRNPDLAGMGTTLVAVLLYGGLAYYFNAGDSRLYRLRDGCLVQISQDHSVKAVTGVPSHMLLNSFGGGKTVFVDCAHLKLLDSDVLLLCSDGLTDMITDDEIEAILNTAQDPAKELVVSALERGGQDNVSAIVIHICRTMNKHSGSEMEG